MLLQQGRSSLSKVWKEGKEAEERKAIKDKRYDRQKVHMADGHSSVLHSAAFHAQAWCSPYTVKEVLRRRRLASRKHSLCAEVADEAAGIVQAPVWYDAAMGNHACWWDFGTASHTTRRGEWVVSTCFWFICIWNSHILSIHLFHNNHFHALWKHFSCWTCSSSE